MLINHHLEAGSKRQLYGKCQQDGSARFP
jgi:putative transposase